MLYNWSLVSRARVLPAGVVAPLPVTCQARGAVRVDPALGVVTNDGWMKNCSHQFPKDRKRIVQCLSDIMTTSGHGQKIVAGR